MNIFSAISFVSDTENITNEQIPCRLLCIWPQSTIVVSSNFSYLIRLIFTINANVWQLKSIWKEMTKLFWLGGLFHISYKEIRGPAAWIKIPGCKIHLILQLNRVRSVLDKPFDLCDISRSLSGSKADETNFRSDVSIHWVSLCPYTCWGRSSTAGTASLYWLH